MSGLATASLVLLGLWLAANLKTSRPDGRLVRGLHPYRRVMGFVMPRRNDSVVYFDTYVDAVPLLAYLEEANRRFPCDVTHGLVAAACVTMTENPTMNRFSLGGRLYDRNGVYVAFSMKRAAMDRQAKLSVVKLRLRDGETFRELCERVNAGIGTERSGKRTYSDKEFDLLSAIPRPLLRLGVGTLKALDYYGLLPASFIENDPLYVSMFCANLGSLKMGAGYHHLYEWGTCSAFLMAGAIEDRPFVENGTVTIRKTLHIRFTYDERIDDGLNARVAIESVQYALEHPYEYFGCLSSDGSDAVALDKKSRQRTGTTSGSSATRAA
jgi:hypothetical protein